MAISVSVHNVSHVRVESYYPANSHSITLSFPRTNGSEAAETTLYGMSENTALDLLNAISKAIGATEMTRVYTPTGTISLHEYMTERAVHREMGTDK